MQATDDTVLPVKQSVLKCSGCDRNEKRVQRRPHEVHSGISRGTLREPHTIRGSHDAAYPRRFHEWQGFPIVMIVERTLPPGIQESSIRVLSARMRFAVVPDVVMRLC